MSFLIIFNFLLFSNLPRIISAQLSPQSLAAQFSLTTSTSIPFPTATQSTDDTASFIVSEWSLSKGRIQNGNESLQFVDDPFPDGLTSTNPVLQVTYDAGSYSHDTGGAQCYSLWNTTDGSVFQSMMLSYDVAFDSGFDWVKGGKLPGLRGGPDVNGCSGGSQPNGSDCFSSRFMWRPAGAGEVYAYILRPNNLCKNSNVTCNSDFGISVQRGSFSFLSGQWNPVIMYVQLNNPANVANGNIMIYYNGVLVEQQTDLQFRRNTDVDIGGFWLSTFFGGNDDSWATPQTTHTYLRNIRLWGSNSPSTLAGEVVSAASRQSILPWHWLLGSMAVMMVMTSLG